MQLLKIRLLHRSYLRFPDGEIDRAINLFKLTSIMQEAFDVCLGYELVPMNQYMKNVE